MGRVQIGDRSARPGLRWGGPLWLTAERREAGHTVATVQVGDGREVVLDAADSATLRVAASAGLTDPLQAE